MLTPDTDNLHAKPFQGADVRVLVIRAKTLDKVVVGASPRVGASFLEDVGTGRGSSKGREQGESGGSHCDS